MKTKEKITVGETLEWLGKLEKLSTKPAKILHIRNLLIRELSLQKQEIVEEIEKEIQQIEKNEIDDIGLDEQSLCIIKNLRNYLYDKYGSKTTNK